MNFEKWSEETVGSLIKSVSNTYKFDKKDKIVLINTSDVLEGFVTNNSYQKYDTIAGQFKKTFEKGDILFSEIRPKNKRFAYIDFDSKNYIASTKLMVLRSKNKNRLDPLYLYYYLTSNEILTVLQNIAESRSGTFPQITFTEVSQLKINLPSVLEQKNIVNFIKMLDKRIELNNKINNNLEELAQTLYKHWFVDFEFPNEEGLPYISSGGKMVESELGLIPEGWIIEPLGNSKISKLITSGINKFNNEKIYLATADVTNTTITNRNTTITMEDKPSRANMQPRENTLWFAKMKNSRKLIRVSKNSTELISDYIFSTGFAGLYVKEYLNFVWTFLLTSSFDENKNGLASGTTQEAINNSTIQKIKILVPSHEVLTKFENATNDLFEKIELNNKENNKLELIRDLLLPKLMSGEIRVPIKE